MELAKQAVAYYVTVTGNDWSQFYTDLDSAMNGVLEEQTGEQWLIHALMNKVIDSGISMDKFKMSKDAIKEEFDNEGRKLSGEYFTPILWAEELHRYIDKYIPNWRESHIVWENSCYSMDTEIFTKRGWVTYNELRDDDLIYTLNPDTLKGEWSGFHNRFKKPYNGTMINFTGLGIDLLVTPDHKMFCMKRVNSRTSRLSVFCSAEEVLNHYNTLPSTSKAAAFHVVTSAQSTTNPFYNKHNLSLVLKRFEDNLAYFWYLVGLYIGDGSYYYSSPGVVNALKFSYKKEHKIAVTKEVLDTLGLEYNIYDYRDSADGKYNFRITDDIFFNFIAKYVGLGFDTKRIPFEQISVEYLSYVLSGMIDTDGDIVSFTTKSYMPKNSLKYWTANYDLAMDLQKLGYLLGYHSHISTRIRKSPHSSKMCTEYNLYLSGKTTHSLMKQNIFEVDYSGEVWDLTTNNDNHVFLVRRNDKCSFSGNCGSGNLIRTAGIKPEHLFGSTLQQDDVDFLNNTPELQGAHIFQLDFLERFDTQMLNEFTDNLPERLKSAIKNDEPIIFLCNPPYKSGQANTTNVGRYMSNNIPYLNNVCFAKPAYDLFYQFCFQVMNIAALHKLTNCYYAVFGPLTWFTGAGANILLKEFERTFEFLDGMCISAQEFSDTSESILWGISATLWKSRGGYISDPSINCHKDILLDKKFIAPDGTIGNEGKVLYAPPRKKLSTWVHEEDKHVGKAEFPLMTSHLTFKGGDVYEKVAHKMVKARNDLWGILMSQDTMTRSSDQSAVMSMPSSIQYEPIVRENFWRAVASYTFRRVYEADWAIAKKDISSPDTTVEGYDIWLKNAIPVFLFEYKSMMSSLRGVVPAGELDYDESQQTKITIRNNFFFLTPEEVREHCTDPVILKDLEENPPTEGQEFMLQVIKECEPYWAQEVRQLYDWCKDYTLRTYDLRKTVNYNGSLECWDAGFQQLRSALWSPDKLNDDMTKLLVQARDFLRKDIMRFGFVTEVQSNEDL